MSGLSSDALPPLAIVAGGGDIPFALADALTAQGRPFVIFAIIGAANAERVASYRHYWVALGQFGRLKRLARAEGCRDVVFIGGLRRPRLWNVRFDLGGLLRLPQIIVALKGGDDHLLRHIGRIFEDDGFIVRGAQELVPQVMMPEGVLTERAPSERDGADIALGLRTLHDNGPRDVGQAIVISNGQVLGLEGPEGTDRMLQAVAQLRAARSDPLPQGVLVKAPKPLQDRRYDLPAIGPTTVAGVVAAGLSGIAVVAEGGVIAEVDRMVDAANRANVFIVGVRDNS